MTFVGIDLAWSDKNPSGLALLTWNGKRAMLSETAAQTTDEEILVWVRERSGARACVSIDAPIIVPNRTGGRQADKALSRDFRRFHANVYYANCSWIHRPISFSLKLRDNLKFSQDPDFEPRNPGRWQIEVYPHSAMVVLFDRKKIIKYKKGPIKKKQKGICELQQGILKYLPGCDPPVDQESLLGICSESPFERRGKGLKDLEDRLDAVVCAYIGLYYWWWGDKKCRVYGSMESGYIVTPIDDRTSSFDTGHLGPSH